ncbi:MAG: hypothetical protein MRZ98_05745 [Clostridiales bacterium]|nr:hypothetical protein [Clostridiales bacterium]MDY4009228.1 hypothetical protein [Candidatus Limiplasma sp.]
MQRVKPKMSRGKAFALLLALIAAAGLLIWGAIRLFTAKPATGVSAAQLPCPYSDTIQPFGKNVLYYDGMSIHCMSDTGAVRWSFQIGADAGYDAGDTVVVAWVGSTIYILDQNGNSSYNDNLGEEVQFARAGSQYVAAVVGETTSPRLLVKDHTGAHMDEEADAYSGLIMLDVGFYGKNGEYMWTLALDVFGTASNTILNTFEVGKMNTGEVSLGEPITYAVVYENSVLRVINTRKMLTFNDRGTEDTSASVLVYGWRYLDSEVPERGDALMLFAPTSQTENMYDLHELRLISGSRDKRYSLPDTCVGATVWNKTVYAFSKDTLYRAGQNDSRFTTYTLPVEGECTQLIGTLTNGKAVIACGDQVYVVTLPQAILN